MSVRDRRLMKELAIMQDLEAKSSLICMTTEGQPPDLYLVSFRCLGMVDRQHLSEEHLAQIYLHSDYPRQPPKVTLLTRCYHPNIAAPIQMGAVQERIEEVLATAPDDDTRKQIMEEILADKELFQTHVCLDALDYNWTPSISLAEICLELGEMIQYKRLNPDHPLNPDAAEWARRNRDRFPVDTRSFLDPGELDGIRILSEESGDPVEIRLLG